MTTAETIDRDEYHALRAEIITRIRLQNVILMLLMPLFLAAALAMAVYPTTTRIMPLIYTIVCGIGGLLWIHHAARTTQIKYYLRLILEPRLRDGGGWERWHAANRVAGLLGSRWRISTIGVFIGSDLAMLGLAWLIAPEATAGSATLLTLAAIGTAAVLLLPPKMSPELRARVAADT
ncbi:hypothetical protein [Glacieibacterium frigidum]|uniref:Uncharacterized protein n=1 Tax=Glacieibacterium frigidum TaxID=2593303 RepID=A0A552UHC0_9SPHN|nr:hypothetical protein [Glacieibacterium frigidum]TRW17624.1 hypothetical protein FMM06_05610 [Glacieibacterium frigidum]